jgi:staphylococcal nuclease domain-containing protein 1
MNVRLRAAKEKKQCLYASFASTTATSSGTRSNGATHGDKRPFEGHVTRIWSGDQLSILDKETNKERRVQLSSTRAPKSVA